MSTVVIIVLALVLAVVVGRLVFTEVRKRGAGGGLRSRFGPEYDRVLARHNGDTRAASRELGQRVREYGSFVPQPLPPELREHYAGRWSAAQERFVESPQHALAEVHELLGGLAHARGFPGPEHRDAHVDALSVHHASHLDGYRRLSAAATSGTAGTEEMREAMLQARAFFDALMAEQPVHARRGARSPRMRPPLMSKGAAPVPPGAEGAPGAPGTAETPAPPAAPAPPAPRAPRTPRASRGHRAPLFSARRHTKGSEAS